MPPPITTAPAGATLSIQPRVGIVPRLATLDSPRQQGREVDHLELGSGFAHAVVQHHGAEGTRNGQRLRAGRGCLLDTLLVYRPAAALLHPHPRATRTTAERALPAAVHLHRPPCRRDQL